MSASVSSASKIISAMLNSNVMDCRSGLPADDLIVVRARHATVHKHEEYLTDKTTELSTANNSASSAKIVTSREYHHHHHHQMVSHHHHPQQLYPNSHFYKVKEDSINHIREEDEQIELVNGDISDTASSIQLRLKRNLSTARRDFIECNQRKVDRRLRGRRNNSFHAHIPCGQVKVPNPQPQHFHHPMAHRQSFKSSIHNYSPSTSLPVHHEESSEHFFNPSFSHYLGVDHVTHPTRAASTGSTHLHDENSIEWPLTGTSINGGNCPAVNASSGHFPLTDQAKFGDNSHEELHTTPKRISLVDDTVSGGETTDSTNGASDEQVLRVNDDHHSMTHDNRSPQVARSLTSPYSSDFAPGHNHWHESNLQRPFTSTCFFNGSDKSTGTNGLRSHLSHPSNNATGYLKQYSSSSPPSPTPGSSSSRVSSDFNEWYQQLRIHSVYDFNRVSHGRVTSGSIDCGYGSKDGRLISDTAHHRAAYSVPASVIGSLDDWIRVKPINVLQLDPVDRAVLKIAGESRNVYSSSLVSLRVQRVREHPTPCLIPVVTSCRWQVYLNFFLSSLYMELVSAGRIACVMIHTNNLDTHHHVLTRILLCLIHMNRYFFPPHSAFFRVYSGG